MRRRWLAPVLGVLALLGAGCPGQKPVAPPSIAPVPSAAAPSAPKLEGELRVLAAASLAAPLTALGAAFEKANPGLSVKLSFGSSTNHERQIEAGAPCDLYVAASQANVDRLAGAALVDSGSVTVVARNELAVIVPESAILPGELSTLRMFPRIAVGARGVPAGEYARAALAGVVDEERRFAGYPDEPSVVTAVAQGAAPAGVCYASSLASHPRRAEVARAPFALPSKTPIVYPAAIVRDAKNVPAARALVAFLGSPEGRAELKKNGFLEP